jgi:hypothetical protein
MTKAGFDSVAVTNLKGISLSRDGGEVDIADGTATAMNTSGIVPGISVDVTRGGSMQATLTETGVGKKITPNVFPS